MSRFTVYGVPGSPYVRSALLGLEEKGADYRLVPLAFGEHKSAEHLARNPFGRIPVIDDGDFRLYETQAILRYLDRVIPEPPLIPTDPRAEARMNQLAGITDCYVLPDISAGVTFPRLVAPMVGLPVDEARIADALPRAEICVAEIARLLGDRPYMAGEAVSIADLMLAPHLSFLPGCDEGRRIDVMIHALAQPARSAYRRRLQAKRGSIMDPTELLFRDDAYARECRARVVGLTPGGGVILDRTVFYAQGGGQPGDIGVIVGGDGGETPIANTVYGEDRGSIVHLPAAGAPLPQIADMVTARLDWGRRYPRMRVHTALHLLSVVLPFPVTGGAVGDGDGRLDFDIPEAGLDKSEITSKLNELIARDAPVRERWITDEELDSNPALVKTMSVKPPRGTGRVRLVEIEGIDLQPCGGTHVRRTGEIGRVVVTDIEKKGKQNRRVRIALA